MNSNTTGWKLVSCLLIMLFALSIDVRQTDAHGGEDHGDEKPKTAQNVQGIVSHTARLGDLEVMVKHPVLEPDTAITARLFVTKFATNEPADKVEPSVEFESSNGAVAHGILERTDSVGRYILRIPALPEGAYTVRVRIAYEGETDTATFAGVQVEHPTAGSLSNGVSWLERGLLFTVGAIVLGLFGILFYFIWKMAGKPHVHDETVSAS